MTEKRNIIMLMPKIPEKTQKDTFDQNIAPVLDKLVKLCDKSGISMQFTAQIKSLTEELPTIITETVFGDGFDPLFDVLDNVSTGDLDIIPLEDGDYYLKNLESDHPYNIPIVLPWKGIIL